MRIVRQATTGRIVLLLAASGLCLSAGCAGSKEASGEAVNTGLAHADKPDAPISVELPKPPDQPPGSDLERLAAESAASLQSFFEEMNAKPVPAETPVASAPPAAAPKETPTTAVQAALAEALLERSDPPQAEAEFVALPETQMGPPAPATSQPIEVAAAELPDTPPEAVRPDSRPLPERIQEATLSLIDLLRQQAVEAASPMKSYLSLAAMEVLWPGALQQIITPESVDGDPLTPDQTTAVELFRDLVIASMMLTDGEGDATERLITIADDLIASRPMRIRAAAMCARVTGFGQYIPLSSRTFLHGRNHPVIIYTEVAPFAYRAATSAEAARVSGGVPPDGTDMWAVELSQEVQIYHDVDGLLVWSRPEQAVVEVSRNRRRDFFLVNEIVLPRTLSVGRYRMKVIMRDKTSQAVDEAVITLEVVADPALASGARD